MNKYKYQNFRKKIYTVIYESDTFYGKLFDIILLAVILIGIILVMLETVSSINEMMKDYFIAVEWFITILFTLEYILRIFCIDRPRKYIFSFYGIVDLLSTLPMYISLFISGTHLLISLRGLRLMRVFRILKIVSFLGEANQLQRALWNSRAKIFIFIYAVGLISVILGTIMYVVEGEENGFTSIPKSIYWTVVTLTTVGYGDIAPQTAVGQAIAAFIMMLGYGTIAVPTGIVSAEISKTKRENKCKRCNTSIDIKKSNYCHNCGEKV